MTKINHLHQILTERVQTWREAGYPCEDFPVLAEILIRHGSAISRRAVCAKPLVFAPGKTIIESLREISQIPYQKILPARLYKQFEDNPGGFGPIADINRNVLRRNPENPVEPANIL